MITVKDIEKKTMTPAKRAMAHNDYFAFYVGRPISYWLTIPFLYTKLSPNQVTMISLIPLIVGLVLSYVGDNLNMLILAWSMFFLWHLLDGVDGNMARYRQQFSKMGSVYDAMMGYVAMIFQPFAWGIIASHEVGFLHTLVNIPSDLFVILGALSGIFVIFPRFIMHKAITHLGEEENLNGVKDKSNYGFAKIVALNMVSPTGFMQVIMLISLFANICDVFTVGYFFINLIVMIVSLKSIFIN